MTPALKIFAIHEMFIANQCPSTIVTKSEKALQGLLIIEEI